MLEEGPSVCERCGGELRRVLFPAGIIFKGSGFYRTDSRAGGASLPSGGRDAGGGKDGDKSSTSKEAGSAATSAPASDAKTSKTAESSTT